MIKTYLSKLSHDLCTANQLLGKISQASNNQSVSDIIDNITNRLNAHASQLDKIINHAQEQADEKQPHAKNTK